MPVRIPAQVNSLVNLHETLSKRHFGGYRDSARCFLKIQAAFPGNP
jgi:hypothetical protein